MPEDKIEKIQWHPAFVAAMDLEFAQNREDIISESEYNLNTQPLRIDLLVIKKTPNVRMENEIGAFFRGYNIMEYKSPDDGMSIDDIYKTMAYASLYKAYGETIDGIKADDITVSLVREIKPVKLLGYFKEHGDEVSNPFKGIYYITSKNYPFPLQIIVTKELDENGHIWLKALSAQLKEEEFKHLIQEIQMLTGKKDLELASSVLEVSVNANKELVGKMKGDEEFMYCKSLMAFFEPEITQMKEQARDEGIQGAVDILRDMGYSDNDIKKKIMKQYKLTAKKAKEYFA